MDSLELAERFRYDLEGLQAEHSSPEQVIEYLDSQGLAVEHRPLKDDSANGRAGYRAQGVIRVPGSLKAVSDYSAAYQKAFERIVNEGVNPAEAMSESSVTVGLVRETVASSVFVDAKIVALKVGDSTRVGIEGRIRAEPDVKEKFDLNWRVGVADEQPVCYVPVPEQHYIGVQANF